MRYAFLLDLRFCTGCNTCTYACMQENRLWDEYSRGLFRRVAIIADEGILHKGCYHCANAACVASCPTGAMYKTPEGVTLYNPDLCIGCKTCISSCPFHAIAWDDEKKQVVRCTMCYHRLKEGKPPRCVEVCPTGALSFGPYEEIVAKARSMASAENLYIYGLEEAGGTSKIIVSKVDPRRIGYPDVPKSLPIGVGPAAVSVGAVAAGIAFLGLKKYSERVRRVAEAEKEKAGVAAEKKEEAKQ